MSCTPIDRSMMTGRWLTWQVLVLLLIVSASPAVWAAVDWGNNVYLPGLGAEHDRLPADEATRPRWSILSSRQPYDARLHEHYLRLTTGDDQTPEQGQLSFRYALPEPSPEMTIEFVARVVEVAGRNWAGSFILSSPTGFAELSLSATHVLLSGAPRWHPGDYTEFHTFRITAESIDEQTVIKVYLNGDPEPIQTSTRLNGPITHLRFGDSSSGEATNGTTDWQAIRWFTQGAMAPRPAADLPQAFSPPLNPAIPIEVAYGQVDDQIWLHRYRDTTNQVSFIVESAGKIYLRVRPRQFPIQADQYYWINTSYFAPRIVQAQEDGQLVLELDGPRNCTVQIEPAVGGNLIPDPTFETTAGRSGDAPWVAQVNTTLKPSLAYGHESLDESGQPLDLAINPQSEATVSQQHTRTGPYSLKLSKADTLDHVEWRTHTPIPVQAGTTYLLSGYYHLVQPQFGSAMHLMVTLQGDGQSPRHFRDTYLNPLIHTPENTWDRSFIRFTVPEGYDTAQVRVSIRGTPFTAYWDDIELRIAPSPVAQMPRQLTEQQRQPRYSPEEVRQIWRDREPVDVEVINDQGMPRLLIDHQPTPLFGFTAGPYRWPGNGAHKDFSDAGVRLHWMPVYMAQNRSGDYGEPLWLGSGEYDFRYLEQQLERMLGYDPDARVLFYLAINPYPAFGDEYPDAAWINFKGQRTIGTKSNWRAPEQREGDEAWNISYTAADFRREAADALQALGQFLAQSTVGKAVVGVHLVCGSDGQWFSQHYPDHWDRSPGNVRAYRDWLKARYGNNQALQQAWDDADVTFDTVQLPEHEQRYHDLFFLDPGNGAHQRLIDASRFNSEGVAETINLLARAFKTGIGRPSIVTTYYHDMIHNHVMNHSALGTLLRHDDLDGIISVKPYGLWRTLGRTGAYSSMAASLRLHNKLYLIELDYRTDYSWLPADAHDYRRSWGVPQGEQAWAHQIRRDLGMTLAQGQGAWIYGLGGNGWLNDRYMQGVLEAGKAAASAANHPIPHDRGQIALFMDEKVEDYSTRSNAYGAILAMAGHNTARATLSRSGLTWDAYLLDDLTHPDRPDYRINMFLSSPTITPRQIEWIEQNLQRDGRVLVFINAAGMSLGEGFEANIKRLTGMQVRFDPGQSSVYRFVPTGVDDPLTRDAANLLTESRQPLFYVDDPSATPLAYLTNTDRKVGMAVKRFDDWTSVYISLPGGFTPSLLRALAAEAGVTPIGPNGDATYAGNGFLVLHAMSPGEKTLRWEQSADVFDLTAGRFIAREVRELSFEMQAGQTRWFRRFTPAASVSEN